MPKLETLLLRCQDPDAQVRFYCDILGMEKFDNGSVGYGAEQASILFSSTTNRYEPQTNDVYWKIALAVPNIELACQQLSAKGVKVGMPKQFQDVGYLSHFTDPEGFTIELIEHWFEGNRPDEPINPDLLGGGAHFNLLTLRTADIEPIRKGCLDLQMTPLSIQTIENHGFTLYFFAFTSDTPPSTDLYAVENREWVYQRMYTVLEIQHVHNAPRMEQSARDQAGYEGTIFSDVPHGYQNQELQINKRT